MFSQKKEEDHSHWISFTDLVSGFMIVFIVISLIALFQLKPCPTCPPPCPSSDIDTISNVTGLKYIELVDIFRNRLQGWQAVEIADSATIRFSVQQTSPDPLFREGKDEPTTYFKSILDRFLPIYFEEMYKLYGKQATEKFQIREIRIEGHTDSRGPYMENLILSSNRALRVQQYLLLHPGIKQYGNQFSRFMEKNSIACGYSFSRLLDNQSRLLESSGQNEDLDKSRRVEFRIILEYKNH